MTSVKASVSLGRGVFEDGKVSWSSETKENPTQADDALSPLFNKNFLLKAKESFLGDVPNLTRSSESLGSDSSSLSSSSHGTEEQDRSRILTAEQLLQEEPMQCAVPMTAAPDTYGQVHPLETPELLREKLAEFDDLVSRMPHKSAASLRVAERRCPELLTNGFKLMFLRADVFDTARSVARYCIYWQKRVAMFGDEDAYKPITLETLNKDDAAFLERGVLQIVEREDGRNYIFIDCSKLDKTAYSADSVLRVIWYMMHAIAEDEEVQKKGVIIVDNFHGFSLNQVDKHLLTSFVAKFKGACPLRLSAFHILHPPSFLRCVFPFALMLIGKRLRKRVLIHCGQKRCLEQLTKTFGFSRKDLTTQLGGEIKLDLKSWLDKRRAEGK